MELNRSLELDPCDIVHNGRADPHISAKRVDRGPDNPSLSGNNNTVRCTRDRSLSATKNEHSYLTSRNDSTASSIMLTQEKPGAVLNEKLADNTAHSHPLTNCSPNETTYKSKITNDFSDIKAVQAENNTVKFIHNLNEKGKRSPAPLAFLPIGLHSQDEDKPIWNFALLDSGASDNLISLRTLQQIPNFDKLIINTVPNNKITLANNDSSQTILGKVTLLLSLLDVNNERICFRSTFHIVNGLVYDLFLGQPFVSSPQLKHCTRTSLFFHSTDQLNEDRASDPARDSLHEIPITYNIKRRLTSTSKTTIPAKSILNIETTCDNITPSNSTFSFYSARPTQLFKQTYPKLHIMHQTVTPRNNTIQIAVCNTSSRPILIKPNHSIAHFQTHLKGDSSLHDLPDMLDHSVNNISTRVSLNKAVSFHNRTKPDLDNVHQCNQAYTSSLHEHPLTEDEKEQRNKQFKMQGCFQKSVSETIDSSNNMPTMTYEGENQFKEKSDSELINDCKLDHLSKEQQSKVIKLLKENLHAFQRHPLDIGCCNGIVAHAPLTVPNPPILYAKYRPIPLQYKAQAQALINQYVNSGVLAPTVEPCTFTSNCFVIPKKDGTFRLIFDGRILSKYCQQLPISLGHMDELFNNLSGKTLVTKLDLSKAYDQIPVDYETSKLLSFFGPDSKRYRFCRAGQGLKFSSFFLTQAMDMILQGLENVHSYCDDIFICTSGTFDEHLALLEKVIKRFLSYNVKLSIAKMEICPPTLDFLGLTWSKDKLSIPQSKVTAYTNLKNPKNLKEARFLINSAAFYRRFIPRFSHIVAPILDLLKIKDAAKHFKRYWNETHQNAVNKLVETIQNSVSLYIPKRDRPFILHTDASFVAGAATVSQYDENNELKLVAAVSRTFVKSERSLAPVQKEILSLLYALTSLHYILRGAKLKVFADAKSVTLLKTCSTSSPYLARLAMELSQFDFELYHLPGTLNVVADALSRMTKDQDDILTEDKLNNNAMTKEESLRFLEFLTIPTNYRFSVSEVKHLISSEPLRSELDQKVQTRLSGKKKSHFDNSPNPIKSKKTHEPRYTNYHPLERNRKRRSETPLSISRARSSSRSRERSNSRKRSRPIRQTQESVATSPSCIHSTNLTSLEELTQYVQNEDYDSSSSSDFSDCDSDLSDFSDTSEENFQATCINTCHVHLTNEISDTDLACVLTDSDRHYESSHVTELTSENEQNSAESVEINNTDSGCSESISNFFEDDDCLHALSEFTLDPDYNLDIHISELLNLTVSVNAVILDETLPDLDLKSTIINDGVIPTKQFQDAQKLDPKIVKLIEENTGRKRTIKVIDDIICRRVKGRYLPVLPESLEKLLFFSEHFHVLGGHRSATSIIQAISDKYYVFDAERKIMQFCKNCYICSIAKSQNMQKAKQGETKKATQPRQIMSFDIFGGLNTTPDGFKYIYSFIDNFSLYVINIKAKTKTTAEMLSAFLQVFAIWGRIPELICTDNESGLMNKEAFDFFKSFQISHNSGPAHASWRLLSEGSSIRKSKNFMRAALISDPKSDWTQSVLIGTIALNNTKTIMGYSPYEMFFGSENNIHDLVQCNTPVKTMEQYFKLVSQNRSLIEQKVKNSRENSVKTRNALINLHRKSKEFEKDQLVWLKALNITGHRASKLKNLGPFRILEKVNPLTYKLARLSEPGKCSRISHASHLEPYKHSIDVSAINFPGINFT